VAERVDAAGGQQGLLLDGFPRNVSQARALDERLGEGAVARVVHLHLEDAEILARLLKRGRPDDREEVIRNRLEVYRAETEPLVDYYRGRGVLATVDAQGAVEEVHERMKRALGPGCVSQPQQEGA
jgi:adenylate kinase